ncbi:40S ribosomal protein S7 [Russula earlei]|uniref:40S ribosomal protein S7 n=1 Tax=Russula earlei TaxID=71964 RepID=A0ACC0UJM9_9AGAM|nr:40S ribosomal protein S7 [Russula earlei]
MQPQPPSYDEHFASFESLPLFMSSLPALQSLVHDGTPDEIARNFKDQGNQYFRGKRYRDALGFYTQGVDAQPGDVQLKEALLLNRAACNLELENYGSVLRDCATVITANSRASKAYYRAGLALLALERADEALDACVRAGEGAADDAGLKALRVRAEKKREELRGKEEEKKQRTRQAAEGKRRMTAALAERNLINAPNPDGSTNPYAPKFDPSDATGRTLILPVFFLYPEHATSDVIPEFVEDTTFGAHLEIMFPRDAPASSLQPWDMEGKYRDDGTLVVYAMTRRKRLLKVGRKMTLRDVCRAAGGGSSGRDDGLEFMDGCLSFVVVPKGEVERKWVEEYKSTGAHSGKPDRQPSSDLVLFGPTLRSPCPHQPREDDDDDGSKSEQDLVMSLQHKILRTANAPSTPPDDTETAVAQALIDLENSVPDLKSELRNLQISAAREVDVRGGKKAIVVFVPVPQLKAFHKVQQRLTRELEKKFSDRHVVFVAQRRILRKPKRNSRVKQKRPRSRTLTDVHDKILEDLVFPTEIVGKRTRVNQDGSKLLKVFLDSKDSTSLEYKLDSFSSVYRRLTGKDVVFEFPVQGTQE